MTNFSIKIISDNVCPVCYLGKARLDRAISTYRDTPNGKSDTFTFSWGAFYIEPRAPPESVPVRQYVANKFGSVERETEIHKQLAKKGAEEGLKFTFSGRTGHTRDSHRLVQLGRSKGNAMENKIVQEIMKMFFEDGGDITNIDDLVNAAEKAGLDPEEAKKWLLSRNGGREVDEEVSEALSSGVRAVPTFIINGKHRVVGAQSVAEFVRQLSQAKATA